MTKPPRARLSSILLAGAFACGGATAKQAGEECVASSECGEGLVCDFGQDPHVCAGSVTIDATEVDAAEIDAAAIDAPPIDAPPIDAPPIDAPIDAAIDAEIDAATDAPPDA